MWQVPSLPSCSVTGHWAVSLLFFRMPWTAKEPLSTSCVLPPAIAVAELAGSLNCHFWLTAQDGRCSPPGKLCCPRLRAWGHPWREEKEDSPRSVCCTFFWGCGKAVGVGSLERGNFSAVNFLVLQLAE